MEEARGDRRSKIGAGAFTGPGRGDVLVEPTESKLRKKKGQEYQVTVGTEEGCKEDVIRKWQTGNKGGGWGREGKERGIWGM